MIAMKQRLTKNEALHYLSHYTTTLKVAERLKSPAFHGHLRSSPKQELDAEMAVVETAGSCLWSLCILAC